MFKPYFYWKVGQTIRRRQRIFHDFFPRAKFLIRIESFNIGEVGFVFGQHFGIARTQIKIGGQFLSRFAPEVLQISSAAARVPFYRLRCPRRQPALQKEMV